jgi:hypothetical protein
MTLRRRDALGGVTASLACALFLWSGCEDQRRHGAAKGAQFVEVPVSLPTGASPEQVTRAFLGAMQQAQAVRFKGLGSAEQREAYDRAFGTLWGLTARPEVHANMQASRSLTLPRNLDERTAVTVALEAWLSTIAHYVDGVQWETMEAQPSSNAPFTTVCVRGLHGTQGDMAQPTPAADSQSASASRPVGTKVDEARITLTLVHKPEGWRVSRVVVGPPRAVTN